MPSVLSRYAALSSAMCSVESDPLYCGDVADRGGQDRLWAGGAVLYRNLLSSNPDARIAIFLVLDMKDTLLSTRKWWQQLRICTCMYL